MIEVKNLTKRYGRHTALDHISFSVEEGTILGFLGPNGAGKSTTMNILTGYLSATEGSAQVGGYDTLEEPEKAKQQIGYLPEIPPLYLDMTVQEYLDFMYELKKVKLPKKEHIQQICALVKIEDVYHRLIANLSKGYRQRVGIAQALLGNPPVLILDEPTVGLDPKQIIEIRNLVKSLGKRHTILLSSHILPEIQAVCDRVLIINKGQLVADGTPDTLAHEITGKNSYFVRLEGDEKSLRKMLEALPHIKKVTPFGEKEPGVYGYTVEAEQGMDVRRSIFHAAAKKGSALLELKSEDLSLEDIFLRLTSESFQDYHKEEAEA